MRAVLAATVWGIYSGYELCEKGSEEYLDSEKFQLRPRGREAAHTGRTIAPPITRLNSA